MDFVVDCIKLKALHEQVDLQFGRMEKLVSRQSSRKLIVFPCDALHQVDAFMAQMPQAMLELLCNATRIHVHAHSTSDR